LPWQRDRQPYRIWISEIMLQQTRVATASAYFDRFLRRFPDVGALARAAPDEVMALWAGLGYYARARHLHRAARVIVERHVGRFPRSLEQIRALPGIGRSTAASIAAFAFGTRAAILDGNVKRVLCRVFAIEGYPGTPAIEKRLWRLAEALLPEREIAAYTQGLIDLGATLCRRSRPACADCPLRTGCLARREGRTAELPHPRPGRVLPHRFATVLLIHQADRVLLERRPPAGVWGGLLSLPELPAGIDARLYCRDRLGLRTRPPHALPEIEHGFTHFRLTIRPLRLEVTGRRTGVAEDSLMWADPGRLTDLALPAPITRLLRENAVSDSERSLTRAVDARRGSGK
jgi:A/G-specific adenine glycosylase